MVVPKTVPPLKLHAAYPLKYKAVSQRLWTEFANNLILLFSTSFRDLLTNQRKEKLCLANQVKQ